MDNAFERARSAYGTGAYDDATLEFLFPKLKESEDERVRKEIISIVKSYRENCIDEGTHRFDDCLSWLEKQKESLHIPDSCKENADSFTDIKNRNIRGCIGMALADVPESRFWAYGVTLKECLAYLEKQKEQPQEELVYRMNGLMQEYIKEGKDGAEKEHRFKCYQLFWDALEDANFFEQKEQKPAEKQDYSDLNDLERAIHRGFLAAGVENVPVTIIKETAKDCLVQTGLIRWELPEDFEEAVFNVVNFMSPFSSEDELREISHRFAEQLLSLAKEEIQKSTWSEDDENMLNEILENYKLRIYLCKSEMEWIESLKHRIQLQQKPVEWSEEDEKTIDDAYCWLCEYAGSLIQKNYGKSSMLYGIANKLKSLRPRWRPSEEQMDRLFSIVAALRKDYCDDMADFLASLYKQLKKL